MGGGGGAGFGGGGGGNGGGGGGSSFVAPGSFWVGSVLASRAGNGSVTIRYDTNIDRCTTVLPGTGSVVAPSSGTADLAVSVTLSAPSVSTVTVAWRTAYAPTAPDDTVLGHQAPTSDYTTSAGTVTFAPGQTSATVHIPVTKATYDHEYVIVSFTTPTNARLGGFLGLGFGKITTTS
jgi:hypothetical protein